MSAVGLHKSIRILAQRWPGAVVLLAALWSLAALSVLLLFALPLRAGAAPPSIELSTAMRPCARGRCFSAETSTAALAGCEQTALDSDDSLRLVGTREESLWGFVEAPSQPISRETLDAAGFPHRDLVVLLQRFVI